MRKMFLLIVISFLFTQIVFGQETKSKLVKIPLELGATMVVQQPDCLLKITDMEFFVDTINKRPIIKYKIQNTSNKAIKYFSIYIKKSARILEWNKYGSGSILSIGQPDGKGHNLLLNGESYQNLYENEFELVPMPKDVKALFTDEDGEPEFKAIWIGAVEEVIFEDGTVYKAKKLTDALQLFL